MEEKVVGRFKIAAVNKSNLRSNSSSEISNANNTRLGDASKSTDCTRSSLSSGHENEEDVSVLSIGRFQIHSSKTPAASPDATKNNNPSFNYNSSNNKTSDSEPSTKSFGRFTVSTNSNTSSLGKQNDNINISDNKDNNNNTNTQVEDSVSRVGRFTVSTAAKNGTSSSGKQSGRTSNDSKGNGSNMHMQPDDPVSKVGRFTISSLISSNSDSSSKTGNKNISSNNSHVYQDEQLSSKKSQVPPLHVGRFTIQPTQGDSATGRSFSNKNSKKNANSSSSKNAASPNEIKSTSETTVGRFTIVGERETSRLPMENSDQEEKNTKAHAESLKQMPVNFNENNVGSNKKEKISGMNEDEEKTAASVELETATEVVVGRFTIVEEKVPFDSPLFKSKNNIIVDEDMELDDDTKDDEYIISDGNDDTSDPKDIGVSLQSQGMQVVNNKDAQRDISDNDNGTRYSTMVSNTSHTIDSSQGSAKVLASKKSRFEVIEVPNDEVHKASSSMSQIIEDDLSYQSQSFVSIKSEISADDHTGISDEDLKYGGSLEIQSAALKVPLTDKTDGLTTHENHTNGNLTNSSVKDDSNNNTFLAPKLKTKRFNVTYETPGQLEKDSELRIEDDTPHSPIHLRSESDISGNDVPQTLFTSGGAFDSNFNLQQNANGVDNDTERIHSTSTKEGSTAILSAIAEANSASDIRNKGMEKKLDSIIERLDYRDQVENETSSTGKYETLISDSKKFQRQTTAFTTQVINMANQWNIQRKRIRRLEQENKKLLEQLKEANVKIQQLELEQSQRL